MPTSEIGTKIRLVTIDPDASTGRTQRTIDSAIRHVDRGHVVLILTATEREQEAITERVRTKLVELRLPLPSIYVVAYQAFEDGALVGHTFDLVLEDHAVGPARSDAWEAKKDGVTRRHDAVLPSTG